MNDVLKTTRKRMEDLKLKREAELAMIAQKREEASQAAQKADAELDEAMAVMDGERYAAASQAKQLAHATLEMFGRHYDMLTAKKLVSEEESDAVIDSLLAYEKKLDENVHDAMAGPLQQLETVVREYRENIRQVEDALLAWQREIHANFRSFDRTQYRNADGNLTGRSETPLPVHRTPYQGSDEALRVDTFLTKNALLTASRSGS